MNDFKHHIELTEEMLMMLLRGGVVNFDILPSVNEGDSYCTKKATSEGS